MEVGDQVICIDDDFTDKVDTMIKMFDQLPKKGDQYTIREVGRTPEGRTRLLLIEIKNPIQGSESFGTFEPGFCASRFRKPETIKEVEEAVEEIGETIKI